MNYKTKSILLVFLLVILMVGIGVFTNYEEITGATTSKKIVCYENSDCDDGLKETEDICRNPGTEYSLCINRLR